MLDCILVLFFMYIIRSSISHLIFERFNSFFIRKIILLRSHSLSPMSESVYLALTSISLSFHMKCYVE